MDINREVEMANRTMAQKTLKLKRQRRAWAKQYRRRGLMVPNREVIQEYKERAQGLAIHMDAADVAAEALMPGKIEIRERLKEQAQLEAELPNGCNLRIAGPTGKDQLQCSWIYFTARKDCFVLVHTDLEKSIERRSTTYSSLEFLIFCWENDAIKWVYNKKIV